MIVMSSPLGTLQMTFRTVNTHRKPSELQLMAAAHTDNAQAVVLNEGGFKISVFFSQPGWELRLSPCYAIVKCAAAEIRSCQHWHAMTSAPSKRT